MAFPLLMLTVFKREITACGHYSSSKNCECIYERGFHRDTGIHLNVEIFRCERQIYGKSTAAMIYVVNHVRYAHVCERLHYIPRKACEQSEKVFRSLVHDYRKSQRKRLQSPACLKYHRCIPYVPFSPLDVWISENQQNLNNRRVLLCLISARSLTHITVML